ncbi:MAG: sulfatase [Lewinellaceae bacterium]|nr:sulfatase [Phaeodactylibacter sp.]MCB0613831.1 sulfatase [Phaeodactylibacter sp.]MCB9351286.1 sulfatase [Lewinellaceae bacterium]
MKIATTLFRYFVLILIALATVSSTPFSPQQPNILFIMSDDHAQQAISSYGSQLITTPHIDRLAKEGALFENSFVTNSICAPSRAVLLTGKYSHLNGVRDNRDTFDGAQPTLPKLLQQAGYYTAIVGKWHLKTEPTGFDYWNVLIGQGQYYNPRMIEMGDTVKYEGYTTTVTTDLALKTLQARPKDKPFCLLYQHKAPHRNFMPEPSYFSAWEKDTLPLPATFYDDYEGRPAAAEADMRVADMYMGFDMKLMPEDYEGYPEGSGGNAEFDVGESWSNTLAGLNPEQRSAWSQHYDKVRQQFRAEQPKGRALTEWKFQRYIKDYLRSVLSVDAQIGRVLAYLDEAGLSDNTIVVYTSDQGFYLGEHGWYDKRFMYEPSLRTPLLIRYPKAIQAGRRISQMALNLDLPPTLLDFAGAPIPEDMQGLSLKPLLESGKARRWRKAIYYRYYEYPHGWHKVRPHYGIRTERYKLIHFENEPGYWELYDLAEDPDELNNLYGQPKYEKRVRQLNRQLQELRRQYRDGR